MQENALMRDISHDSSQIYTPKETLVINTILVSGRAGLTHQEIESILVDFGTTPTARGPYPINPPVKTLYASEYDLPAFRQHCSPEICGLLIGFPFGGLSDSMVLNLINQAAELDCRRAVVTLSVNDLVSGCLNTFEKKILTYARKAADCSLECIWEIPAALLTESQLLAALRIIAETSSMQTSSMQTDNTRLSLATGTSLDSLDIQTVRTADRLISQLSAPFLLEIDQKMYTALKEERKETPGNNFNSTIELRTCIPQDGGIAL